MKKLKRFYVTFQIKYVHYKTIKIAVETFCIEDAKEILHDAYSINGISYLRLNKCGRLSNDYIKMSIKAYKKTF